MKNFNRRSAVPMVTMAQSASNWRNTHTHVDCTHSLTHLHQHSYNQVVQSAFLQVRSGNLKWLIISFVILVVSQLCWSAWNCKCGILTGEGWKLDVAHYHLCYTGRFSVVLRSAWPCQCGILTGEGWKLEKALYRHEHFVFRLYWSALNYSLSY